MTTRGAVVWLTGLPASGKTTLAIRLSARLHAAGREAVLLDSDELREAIVPAHGYDDPGRDAFYRTLIGLACIVARQGRIVIVAATAHRRAWRDLARVRAPCFVEVHVATPLAECRRRDPKGLYARLGPASTLPGAAAAAAYEPPLHPEVVATNIDDDAAITAILARLG